VSRVGSENIADRRLGADAARHARGRCDPRQSLDDLAASHHLEHRQLTLYELACNATAHSGAGSLGIYHHRVADGVVAREDAGGQWELWGRGQLIHADTAAR
jgi:hypothetical protein